MKPIFKTKRNGKCTVKVRKSVNLESEVDVTPENYTLSDGEYWTKVTQGGNLYVSNRKGFEAYTTQAGAVLRETEFEWEFVDGLSEPWTPIFLEVSYPNYRFRVGDYKGCVSGAMVFITDHREVLHGDHWDEILSTMKFIDDEGLGGNKALVSIPSRLHDITFELPFSEGVEYECWFETYEIALQTSCDSGYMGN